MVEGSSLPCCYAVSTGTQLPTFRSIVAPSSSGYSCRILLPIPKHTEGCVFKTLCFGMETDYEPGSGLLSVICTDPVTCLTLAIKYVAAGQDHVPNPLLIQTRYPNPGIACRQTVFWAVFAVFD